MIPYTKYKGRRQSDLNVYADTGLRGRVPLPAARQAELGQRARLAIGGHREVIFMCPCTFYVHNHEGNNIIVQGGAQNNAFTAHGQARHGARRRAGS